MKKYKSIIWITVFLIITVSPVFTWFFLGQYVDSENYENRNMASRPVFSMRNYEAFPRQYEAYYNDNIPFRNQLIRFNNSIDYFLFGQSPSERVDIGKDGWLFYCDNTDNNPVEQSLGFWHFTDEQLQNITDNLMTTKRVLESQGIEFVLFIAPNKETIYMDKLPEYYESQNQYTSTDQLVAYLAKNTDVRVIYPKQDLLNAKKEKPDVLLYHKLDTHWNYAGAYVGAKALASELGINMPSLDKISLEPTLSSSGDLSNILNISIKNGNIDYNISGINTLNTTNEKWDYKTEFIYHTANADPRNLLVRRDSFSTSLAPNLATQFENSIWIHLSSFNPQQIFDYDSDIFVLEIVERYEDGLEDLRISLLSSSVESTENEKKKITITPISDKINLQNISIFKKNNETENAETVQVLEPLGAQMVLNVPEDETGKIYIYIFADESGDKMIEEVAFDY